MNQAFFILFFMYGVLNMVNLLLPLGHWPIRTVSVIGATMGFLGAYLAWTA